jgi:NADH dehydrogenase FAD-containing subunit
MQQRQHNRHVWLVGLSSSLAADAYVTLHAQGGALISNSYAQTYSSNLRANSQCKIHSEPLRALPAPVWVQEGEALSHASSKACRLCTTRSQHPQHHGRLCSTGQQRRTAVMFGYTSAQLLCCLVKHAVRNSRSCTSRTADPSYK